MMHAPWAPRSGMETREVFLWPPLVPCHLFPSPPYRLSETLYMSIRHQDYSRNKGTGLLFGTASMTCPHQFTVQP